MPAKFEDIVAAFEFVSSAGPSEDTALVHKSTGEIVWHSEGGDMDEVTDEMWESDDYVAVPHKYDLDLGQDLVFRFVGAQMPDEYDEVRAFFRRPGAYARYKDLLDRKDLLQAWYDFENATVEKALRQWCKDEGIELAE